MHTLSVSELNEQIKNLLESTFTRVLVEGELSRITYHNSGHIYFTLKDKNAAISCVMFRGNASKLKFRLEEGLKVMMDAALTLYVPRGSYQLNAFSIEPAGHGALALAYEQLKKRLEDKGYFDSERKKAFVKIPKTIALVTSATGAALQDMQRVAQERWPLVRLFVYDTLVQGDGAAPNIVQAIQAADTQGFDAIVVGRGGGSMEDLWAFNEEVVADAIYQAKTPIISAVGHEIDWVISDFVADLRAPTPSAAMQMILPDRNEYYQTIDGISTQYDVQMRQKLYRYDEQLSHLYSAFEQNSIEQKINNAMQQVSMLQERFHQSINYKLERAQSLITPLIQTTQRQIEVLLNTKAVQVQHATQALENLNPKRSSKEGYAQVSKDGKVVSLDALKVGDTFEAMSASLIVSSEVKEIKNI